MYTILPGYALYRIRSLYTSLIIMILGTIIILLAPVITKDNMARMSALQYSTKTGRKTLAIQLAAMLFSAFIIAAVQIAVVFGLFIRVAWFRYLGSGLHSFTDPYNYSWFSGTFLQYFLTIAAFMLIFTLAAAMLVFALSKLSKHYITLLLGIVPLAAALFFGGYWVFRTFLNITSSYTACLYSYIPIPYVEAYICGLLLIIGAVAAGLLLKKQKRAEVLG
jgi:hypothetical protein